MSTSPSPVSSAVGPVRVGQLWQDMAPDMVDRERMLRVLALPDTHAECVVERDKQGTAGRKARPLAIRRFATRAFKLIEDVVARGVRDRGTARAPRTHRRGGEGPLTGPREARLPSCGPARLREGGPGRRLAASRSRE